jgi:hypothetical protein
MYSAVRSLESAVKFGYTPTNPYGREALAKARQAQARPLGYESDSVYRSFFRYTDDLLFDGLGSGWLVCDRCSLMVALMGPRWGSAGAVGEGDRSCPDCARKGVESTMRPIGWEDLRPSKVEAAGE